MSFLLDPVNTSRIHREFRMERVKVLETQTSALPFTGHVNFEHVSSSVRGKSEYDVELFVRIEMN